MQYPNGTPVIGRLTNTAVNTVQTIAFSDVQGVARAFLPGDRLLIYAIHTNNRATAKDLTIFQDQNANGSVDAGDEILVNSFATAGSYDWYADNGFATVQINAAATNIFKALGSAAGAVDIQIIGEIVRS